MRVETFALFSGIAYLAAGLLGLVPGGLMPAPADAPPIHVTLFHGYLLGLFPVNVLHSAVHFAIGVWGIVAGRGMTSPKVYARSLAIFYGALAAMGGIPGLDTLFGLLPIRGFSRAPRRRHARTQGAGAASRARAPLAPRSPATGQRGVDRCREMLI